MSRRIECSGSQGGLGDPGGPGGLAKVVKGVQVVRINSPDHMHSENIWFLWSKPSNYQEKLRCHACDGQTEYGGRTKGGGKLAQVTCIQEIYGFCGLNNQIIKKS